MTNGRDSITIVEPLREAVDSMLGNGAATRLKRGEAVQWGDFTVQQSTERNLTRDTVGGAILAVFIDDKTLELLDRIYRRNSLVVVDFMDTAAEWKARNTPIDLLANDEDDE